MIKAKWLPWKDFSNLYNICEHHIYDLVFFGDDFCDRLIPDEEDVINAYDLLYQNNISFGIKTPVISEHNLDAHCKLIDILGKLQGKIYVTVNDLGLFHYITEKCLSNIEIVVGRFLTRQKVDRFTSQLIGKIPDVVYEHFCTPTLLNEAFIKYAISKGVHLYEIENVDNNIVLPQLDYEYKIMLSYPYVCTSLTRYCPYYQFNNAYLKIKTCNKECLNESIILHAEVHGEYKFISNALVFKNQNLPSDLNNIILLDESERG